MTTDTGVDLVAYSPKDGEARTIQVKTNHKAKPGGGSGKSALDWWLRKDSPAELVAFVDLSSEKVWLMTHSEVEQFAQQRSGSRLHLYMYTDPTARPRKKDRLSHQWEFNRFLLENYVHITFSIQAAIKTNQPAKFYKTGA
ncbi:hypothetical protein [Salinicola socius]|nr:hypothetical protein [Salinicola socius]